MEKETRKELIKKFREKVAGGKYAGRDTLLAYAFLRGVPYVALERVINEDHPSFGTEGRNEFLRWRKYSMSREICEAQFSGQSVYQLRKENKESEALLLNEKLKGFREPLEKEIWDWIQEKYKAKSEEAAA